VARSDKEAPEDAPDADREEARSADELFDVPEGERGGMPDLLRRMMTAGFSGLFTTESAIRGALGDTVPREWVDFVASQSDRTRDEFLARLAQEFVRVLESVDVVQLAEQMLEGRTIEIKAELKLGPRRDPADQPANTASFAVSPTSAPRESTSGSGASKNKRKEERP
jgi:hypothetical protein